MAGFSSEHWFRWEYLFEYSQGRLEAGTEHKLCHLWSKFLVSGAFMHSDCSCLHWIEFWGCQFSFEILNYRYMVKMHPCIWNICTLNTCIWRCSIMQDPNPEDPLNKEAAEMFQNNQRSFESMVARSILHGAHISNTYFPPCHRWMMHDQACRCRFVFFNHVDHSSFVIVSSSKMHLWTFRVFSHNFWTKICRSPRFDLHLFKVE